MIKARPALAPEWYVPLAERESENPTRFLLRPLTGVEVLDMHWRRNADGEWFMDAACAGAGLRRGLLAWENFADEKGPVSFDAADQAANLARLPRALVIELASEIFVRSHNAEAERKNS